MATYGYLRAVVHAAAREEAMLWSTEGSRSHPAVCTTLLSGSEPHSQRTIPDVRRGVHIGSGAPGRLFREAADV
jgi:hypothetical protein